MKLLKASCCLLKTLGGKFRIHREELKLTVDDFFKESISSI